MGATTEFDMSFVKIARVENGDRTLPVFEQLEQRMNAVREKAFDLFAQRGGTGGGALDDWVTAERAILGWSPAELKEQSDAYDVDMTLPGFAAKEVEVTATDHEVIIHAEHASEQSEKKDGVVWTEFGSSAVYRRFSLPTPVRVACACTEGR
jgi:HSP20 family molecular chaperone IbpA